MEKTNKENVTFYLKITVFLLLAIVVLFFTVPVDANVYIIKDKNGNVVRVTNQHQMNKEEKNAGYSISILIESNSKKETRPFFPSKAYNFKEKIDWEKVKGAAQIIEQKLKNNSEMDLNYPVYRVLATAYTPDERCCAPYADGYTATGYPAGYGSIAIDPDYGMFQYGDVLYVEGYGLGVADDCGSAIKGKHIDVCFNLGELQRADNWGRKYVRVWKIE